MTLKTDYTLKEDAKSNLKPYFKMAHFNFSQPLYLQADVGGEEGDLEYSTKPERPGASPGARCCPAAAPQLPWPPKLGPPSPPRPGWRRSWRLSSPFSLSHIFWLLLFQRLFRAGARCGGAWVSPVPQRAQTRSRREPRRFPPQLPNLAQRSRRLRLPVLSCRSCAHHRSYSRVRPLATVIMKT